MSDAAHVIGEQTFADVLVIGDHASNRVPQDIHLGLDPALLSTHIGWDIGVAALAEALGMPRFLGNISRLVVDLNREPSDPGLVPNTSDGHVIPGNIGDMSDRIMRYWQAYHDDLAALIGRTQPALLVSLHSFTPVLSSAPNEMRPWEIGILYNNDDRAARIAIPALAAAGICVGDQLPYSGKVLNATMNRHGEGNGIAYLGIEVRQDLIETDDGVAKWSRIIAPVIGACLDDLRASGTRA